MMPASISGTESPVTMRVPDEMTAGSPASAVASTGLGTMGNTRCLSRPWDGCRERRYPNRVACPPFRAEDHEPARGDGSTSLLHTTPARRITFVCPAPRRLDGSTSGTYRALSRPAQAGRPRAYRDLSAEYRVHDLVERDGQVPLVWWPNQPNFGDLLSPWLFEKMTGKPVVHARRDEVAYVSIGSVLKRVTPGALVWGTGSFGNEQDPQIELDATYFAVRGPLTRARLLDLGAKVKPVYGDPALLAPLYQDRKSTR